MTAKEKIKLESVEHPNWASSEKELRELREQVMFAVLAEEEDMDKAAGVVEELFH